MVVETDGGGSQESMERVQEGEGEEWRGDIRLTESASNPFLIPG